MERPELDGSVAARIAALERRCARLSRGVAALLALGVLLVMAQLARDARASQAAKGAAAPDGVLTLRELVVVDPDGTPRVRIAAPLPDPIMLGKRFRRGDAVSGILIYDAEGNERGGYVTGDVSRDAALTLDEINRAAIHLGVGDRGEMHLHLDNGQRGFAGLGLLPSGGFLRLDRDGVSTLLPPDAAATPAKGDGR
jgi:hypothetical protein